MRRGAPSKSPARKEPEIPKSWRIIAGTHAVQEALKIGDKGLRQIWLRQGWESSQDLREFADRAKALKLKTEVKPPGVLDNYCSGHQGALVFSDRRPELQMADLKERETSVIMLLDGLEDPHNLGAILRTAWLTGADGLFVPTDRAVGLTSTVHKVACGGAEHVPVVEVTNFGSSVEALKEKGYWVFGLSHKAKKSLFEVKLPEKVVWAIGAEDKGLRLPTERLCDELVSLPQASDAASYNASVAAGMALMETLRQHRELPKKP